MNLQLALCVITRKTSARFEPTYTQCTLPLPTQNILRFSDFIRRKIYFKNKWVNVETGFSNSKRNDRHFKNCDY